MFSEPVNDGVNDTVNDTVNKLAEKEKLILKLINENPKMTRLEISQTNKISTATVSRIISKLRKLGVLERKGSDKTGYWVIK